MRRATLQFKRAKSTEQREARLFSPSNRVQHFSWAPYTMTNSSSRRPDRLRGIVGNSDLYFCRSDATRWLDAAAQSRCDATRCRRGEIAKQLKVFSPLCCLLHDDFADLGVCRPRTLAPRPRPSTRRRPSSRDRKRAKFDRSALSRTRSPIRTRR